MTKIAWMCSEYENTTPLFLFDLQIEVAAHNRLILNSIVLPI